MVGTDPFTILGGLKVDIRMPYFGTSNALVAGDFQAAASLSNVATFRTTPVSDWYTAVLKATGYPFVNPSGTTQFRLRFVTDDNNDNGADYMRFLSGDHATLAARPTLIIDYIHYHDHRDPKGFHPGSCTRWIGQTFRVFIFSHAASC